MKFWLNAFTVGPMGVWVHYEIIFLSLKYLIVNLAAGKYSTLTLACAVSAIMVGRKIEVSETILLFQLTQKIRRNDIFREEL